MFQLKMAPSTELISLFILAVRCDFGSLSRILSQAEDVYRSNSSFYTSVIGIEPVIRIQAGDVR